LEDSGSVGPGTGWTPAPLLLEDGGGRLLGALPAYAKSHSQGEYVFDHAWADAWERAGGHYYPKLQGAAPFTPATGPRLLLADDSPAAPLLRAAEPPRRLRCSSAPAGSRAATSSSTGTTAATPRSTSSSPRCPRASARRCARNAPPPNRVLRSARSAAATSAPSTGTPSGCSTRTPARA